MKHTVAKCKCGNLMYLTYMGPNCIIYRNCLLAPTRKQRANRLYRSTRLAGPPGQNVELLCCIIHSSKRHPKRVACSNCLTHKNFGNFIEIKV